MRPQKAKTTGKVICSTQLDQIINMKHELVQLAGKIDWDWIDCEIAPLYSDTGRPGIATQSSSGSFCSSTSTVCPTKGCASIWVYDPSISSTSPARSFSSTSSLITSISAVGGSALAPNWSFCWPRV